MSLPFITAFSPPYEMQPEELTFLQFMNSTVWAKELELAHEAVAPEQTAEWDFVTSRAVRQ